MRICTILRSCKLGTSFIIKSTENKGLRINRKPSICVEAYLKVFQTIDGVKQDQVMSSNLRRKARNYEERVLRLEQQYSSIGENLKKSQWAGNSDNFKTAFELIYELDSVLYKYHALKSYLEASKQEVGEYYKEIMQCIEEYESKFEKELPIPDIIVEFPDLAIIRRQLHESSREAGKIALQCEKSGLRY